MVLDKDLRETLIVGGTVLSLLIGGRAISQICHKYFPSERRQLERLADENHNGDLDVREKFKMYHMCGISAPGEPTPITSYKLTKDDIRKGLEAYRKESSQKE